MRANPRKEQSKTSVNSRVASTQGNLGSTQMVSPSRPAGRSVALGPRETVFTVFPEVVNFENIQADLAYYVYIKVQNQTKKQQNIRVLPPVSPYFALQVEGGQRCSLACAVYLPMV